MYGLVEAINLDIDVKAALCRDFARRARIRRYKIRIVYRSVFADSKANFLAICVRVGNRHAEQVFASVSRHAATVKD